MSQSLIEKLAGYLLDKQSRLVTAESCTGGLVSAALTEISGSSQWFDCGFVTYSNQAKQDLLSVSGRDLQQHGAVSEVVAQQMAIGALAHSQAQLAVAITGIAGPTGATVDKPLGSVWFAWAGGNDLGTTVLSEYHCFAGNRQQVRQQAVQRALTGCVAYLESGAQSVK